MARFWTETRHFEGPLGEVLDGTPNSGTDCTAIHEPFRSLTKRILFRLAGDAESDHTETTWPASRRMASRGFARRRHRFRGGPGVWPQVADERVSLDTIPGPPSDWDPEVDRMDYGEAECSVTVRAWQDDKTEEDERHGED